MYNTTTITNSYTVLNNIKIVFVHSGATAITITMPDPTKYKDREITITRYDSSDTATVTITTVLGTNVIENPATNNAATSYTIESGVKSLRFCSDGGLWHIIGNTTINVGSTIYKGSSSQSSSGLTTSFNIPHGIGASPTFAIVNSLTDDGGDIRRISYDNTNITVYYDTAPVAGSFNLLFNWLAI